MDALEFLRERKRMCKSFNKCSDGCPAWTGSCELETGTVFEWEADEQVEIVNEWAAAHPRKTRQSVFLEQWPEAWTHADGVLSICPNGVADWHRSTFGTCIGGSKTCKDCRREFWMQEVE